jgi:hypothetical protein
MKNTKLTNILLIILLVFNVAFIGKWWMGHRRLHHPKKEVETTTLMNDRNSGGIYLVKTLGLDTLQQKQLDKILALHYNLLDIYMRAYIRIQTKFFNSLKDNQDSTAAFHCADSMGILKVTMERELYSNFISIKNICNGGQQKLYDQLIDNISEECVRHHTLSNNPKTNHDTL